MSVYNSIYAEVKVGDKWFSLNPIVKNYKGEYVSTALLLGQSWLNDTVNTLRDYASSSGLPEDASEETLKHFSPPSIRFILSASKRARESCPSGIEGGLDGSGTLTHVFFV